MGGGVIKVVRNMVADGETFGSISETSALVGLVLEDSSGPLIAEPRWSPTNVAGNPEKHEP